MNPNFWKTPTSRLGLVLSWVGIAALFFIIALLMNLGHETSHWILWKRSNIPSCVYFNITIPGGSLQVETRFLWGIVGGPLFNLTAGFALLILYWKLPSIRGFLIWVITYSLLIRPVVVLIHWLFLGPGVLPPDEVFLHRILSADQGELVASLAFVGILALMLTPIFILWRGPARTIAQRFGLHQYFAGALLVLPLILSVVLTEVLVTFILSPWSDIPLFGVCP